MRNVRSAAFAELFQLQTIFDRFLVFSRAVVDCFAISTLEFNHVVLRHIGGQFLEILGQFPNFVNGLVNLSLKGPFWQ